MQVARAKGARVLATAGSDNIALLCDLGVVAALDDTTTRFEDVAREVDVVVDMVAGDLTARSLAVLKPGGISVTAAGQPDAAAAAARGVRARGKRAQPLVPEYPHQPVPVVCPLRRVPAQICWPAHERAYVWGVRIHSPRCPAAHRDRAVVNRSIVEVRHPERAGDRGPPARTKHGRTE